MPVIIPQPETGTSNSLVSILYYATPQNDLFLGAGDKLADLADDIARARGVCGYNCEYLLRITDFLRAQVPTAIEPHLYHLDELVRIKLGLDTNNVLPWTSLITMKTFHKKLTRSVEPADTQQSTTEDMSSSLQLVHA